MSNDRHVAFAKDVINSNFRQPVTHVARIEVGLVI